MKRRDFLKVTSMAGAAAAVTLKQQDSANDLSRISKFDDTAGRPARPWWVKKVDRPTVEVDWDRIERFDARSAVLGLGINFSDFVDPKEIERLDEVAAKNELERLLEKTPGYTLPDQALYESFLINIHQQRSFLGPQKAKTPEERGIVPWEGTPEEAARILRVTMRHLGAAQVGFVELDEYTRKLIYSHDPDGKELHFEDVDQAYETPERRAIPNKVKWAIAYTVQMSNDAIKRAPTVIAAMSTLLSYERAKYVQLYTQEFLRGLGYQGLGQGYFNGLGIAPAFGVLTGLGELSRQNRLITPEYGPMVRIFTMLTDLPVAVDKPIDAGILRFCKSCRKCAEACPSGAISLAEEPEWGTAGSWNNPGHKAYFENAVKCFTFWRETAGSDCSICFSVCPFSKKDKAWIYDVVKATISNTTLLNGTIRSLDDGFSYGAQKSPEEWWHLDMPEYGINE